jgi:hypothetical protein
MRSGLATARAPQPSPPTPANCPPAAKTVGTPGQTAASLALGKPATYRRRCGCRQPRRPWQDRSFCRLPLGHWTRRKRWPQYRGPHLTPARADSASTRPCATLLGTVWRAGSRRSGRRPARSRVRAAGGRKRLLCRALGDALAVAPVAADCRGWQRLRAPRPTSAVSDRLYTTRQHSARYPRVAVLAGGRVRAP